MENNQLFIYNTLTRKKELFVPLHAPHVGMYVCGPTVYGDGHLGHARPAITFDIVFRYLTHLGYKVRYVRNITDVGHLEHDADDGEDKIAKKARLEQLEPMEVVQYYLLRYHKAMEALNVLPPSIEPHASGHIIEQIKLVEEILKNGYAYESKGSVYFDVAKYNKDHHYGVLSGRNLDDVLNTTRELDGQDEKHNPADFALWKCAQPEHIMRWPSPWSNGFPGWHCECTAMGRKYLGETFDIHGGGMDLVFPHHECEIAQAVASEGHQMVRYWMHNNMITINGQKMGKSLGNFITLDEFFTGSNKLLTQAYSPMTIRFFILQAHYRSTVVKTIDKAQADVDKYKKKVSECEDYIYYLKNNYKDTSEYDGKLDVFKSSLETAQNALDSANDNYASVLKNTDRSVASAQNTVDMQKYQASTTTESKDQLEQLQKQLADCTLSAPISGVVTAVNVSVGDKNTAGTTMITIVDTSSLKVVVNVEEADILKIQEGMPATVSTDATGDEEIKGTVTRVVRVKNQSTNTNGTDTNTSSGYSAEITIDNTELLVGMSAKAKIVIKDRGTQLAVPYDLIRQDDNGDSYVLVAEANEDGTATAVRKNIKVGEEVDYYTEVTGGDLKEGDQLIYDNTFSVTEGQVFTPEQIYSNQALDTEGMMSTEAE